MGERVVVAMSGGVDSSVAALLEKQAGSEVIGITMQMYDQGRDHKSGKRQGCCALDDTLDARRVAEHLEIPHYVLNHEVEFQETVVRPYVEDYLSGRTPSPCVRCNTYVKFDALLMRARALGATTLVTGHYAGIVPGLDGGPVLCEGIDLSKDQSYFLFGIPGSALRSTRFPLWRYTKKEIRAFALEAGLPTAGKPESMETCFVGEEGPAGFVEKVAPKLGLSLPETGKFVDEEGSVLGSHSGVHNFTVGQRKGLGIATGSRTFVREIDADTGNVHVGSRDQLLSQGLSAKGSNWFGKTPEIGSEFRARIRHGHRGVAARLTSLTGDGFELEFLEPVFAVAPGQAVVLYRENMVAGGGWISESFEGRLASVMGGGMNESG